MQLAKPKVNIPAFLNERSLNLGMEPVTIKAGMLMQVSKISDNELIQATVERQNSIGDAVVEAPLSLLSCLNTYKK